MAQFDKWTMNGPIPGENYTSDRRNYPWHRPPEYTELDESIEYLSKVLGEDNAAAAIITMIEMDIDIATISDIILTKGVGAGKWSVDLALILAGPLSHMLVIMARTYGVDFKLVDETPNAAPTLAYFNEVKALNKKKVAAAADAAETAGASLAQMATLPQMGGFMSNPMEASSQAAIQSPAEEMTEPTDNPQEEQLELEV